MKKYHQNFALGIVGAFLLLVAAFAGGLYVGSNEASDQIPSSTATQIQQINTDQVPNTDTDTKLYKNEQRHFSVRYPADLEVQEGLNGVVFGYQGEPWFSGYSVQTEEVPFTSTVEWLDAQTKGNFSSEGYELILWLDHNQQTAIVAEYVEYDRRPDGTYVHGRYFYAVRIDNGILYKFHVGGAVQFEERGVPRISSDSLEFVHSFKPYIE